MKTLFFSIIIFSFFTLLSYSQPVDEIYRGAIKDRMAPEELAKIYKYLPNQSESTTQEREADFFYTAPKEEQDLWIQFRYPPKVNQIEIKKGDGIEFTSKGIRYIPNATGKAYYSHLFISGTELFATFGITALEKFGETFFSYTAYNLYAYRNKTERFHSIIPPKAGWVYGLKISTKQCIIFKIVKSSPDRVVLEIYF